MTKSKPPQQRGKKNPAHDQKDETRDEDSEDESLNESYTGSDNSYEKIKPRNDLPHRCVKNTTEVYRRSAHNVSASSAGDSPDRNTGIEINTSRRTSSDHSGDRSASLSDSNILLSSESEGEENGKLNVGNENCGKIINQFKIPFVVLCIVISGVYFVYFKAQDLPEKPQDNRPPFDIFVSHVSNLARDFPSQEGRLWRTVQSSARHVLQDAESNYPVVLLMASHNHHAHISRCIAKKIASSFEVAQRLLPEESSADINEMSQNGAALQKQLLDESLHSAFSEKLRKSFIIKNLRSLHPEAALLLHGYCDNDNAPYKDVMIILLLNIDPKEVADLSSSSVENFLEDLWTKELEVDKVKALLSRVANNIVTVREEDEETLSSVCA